MTPNTDKLNPPKGYGRTIFAYAKRLPGRTSDIRRRLPAFAGVRVVVNPLLVMSQWDPSNTATLRRNNFKNYVEAVIEAFSEAVLMRLYKLASKSKNRKKTHPEQEFYLKSKERMESKYRT
jgi:hypothetical protein